MLTHPGHLQIGHHAGVALRRQEEAMWDCAQRDPRVMADLQMAWMREQDSALPFDPLRAASR